jgi:hypothetical protein
VAVTPETKAAAVDDRLQLANDRAKAARLRATLALRRAEDAEKRVAALAARHDAKP